MYVHRCDGVCIGVMCYAHRCDVCMCIGVCRDCYTHLLSTPSGGTLQTCQE